jgi:hypothetical protein
MRGTRSVQSLPRLENTRMIQLPPADEAIAVVLDLVDPLRPGGDRVAVGWQARLDRGDGERGQESASATSQRSNKLNAKSTDVEKE